MYKNHPIFWSGEALAPVQALHLAIGVYSTPFHRKIAELQSRKQRKHHHKPDDLEQHSIAILSLPQPRQRRDVLTSTSLRHNP